MARCRNTRSFNSSSTVKVMRSTLLKYCLQQKRICFCSSTTCYGDTAFTALMIECRSNSRIDRLDRFQSKILLNGNTYESPRMTGMQPATKSSKQFSCEAHTADDQANDGSFFSIRNLRPYGKLQNVVVLWTLFFCKKPCCALDAASPQVVGAEHFCSSNRSG